MSRSWWSCRSGRHSGKGGRGGNTYHTVPVDSVPQTKKSKRHGVRGAEEQGCGQLQGAICIATGYIMV